MSKPFTYWVRLATVATLCTLTTFNPVLAGRCIERLLKRNNCLPAACIEVPACESRCVVMPACEPVVTCETSQPCVAAPAPTPCDALPATPAQSSNAEVASPSDTATPAPEVAPAVTPTEPPTVPPPAEAAPVVAPPVEPAPAVAPPVSLHPQLLYWRRLPPQRSQCLPL